MCSKSKGDRHTLTMRGLGQCQEIASNSTGTWETGVLRLSQENSIVTIWDWASNYISISLEESHKLFSLARVFISYNSEVFKLCKLLYPLNKTPFGEPICKPDDSRSALIGGVGNGAWEPHSHPFHLPLNPSSLVKSPISRKQ